MSSRLFFFFFPETATTEIYTLSLHDALPICSAGDGVQIMNATIRRAVGIPDEPCFTHRAVGGDERGDRSEEHTSELQSRLHLVCRLLLEKKKTTGSFGGVRVSSEMSVVPNVW